MPEKPTDRANEESTPPASALDYGIEVGAGGDQRARGVKADGRHAAGWKPIFPLERKTCRSCPGRICKAGLP